MFSINKVIYLLLFITMAHGLPALAQEESRYRVEVLVLRHLDAIAEPEIVAELRALPQHLDLIPDELATGGTGTLTDDPLAIAPPDHTLLPPVGPFPDELPWAKVDRLENRSEFMDGVWRNLRLSSGYRPEAFLAWEQPGDAPFPLVRLRNQEVAGIVDSFAELRSELSNGEYVFYYALDRGDFALVTMPPAEYRYTIDGTVSLRRSRFLHVDLDLAFTLPAPGGSTGPSGPPLLAQDAGYKVYRLRQSRQIRKERLEYFDSPSLGALVWVVEIELSENGGTE